MARRRLVLGIIFWILAFIGLLAPIVVWCVYRREIYFATSISKSISTGLMFGAIVITLLLTGVLKSLDKLVSSVVVMLAFAGVLYLISPIVRDMWIILLCASGGLCFFIIFRAIARPLTRQHSAYVDEKMRVEARREARSATDEEVFM